MKVSSVYESLLSFNGLVIIRRRYEMNETTQETQDKLLKMSDVAEMLNLSYGTIRNLVSADEIPYVRLRTRTVRFRRGDIEKMLTAAARGNAGTGGGA